MLKVEFTRLRWRRAVLLLVAAAIVVPLVILGGTIWATRPVSTAESASIRTQIQRDDRDPAFARELINCVKHPDLYGIGKYGNNESQCREITQPKAGWYFSRESLDLVKQRGESGISVVVVLATLMMLVGTTFAGHDWNTGSVTNQLLAEPRRDLIWSAKGLSVLVLGLFVATVSSIVFWSGLWVVGDLRGLHFSGAEVSGSYFSGLRGALLAAFAGLMGYALTMMFRSTVITLGTLFAISVIAPLLISAVNFDGGARLMPQYNFLAVVLNGIDVDSYGEDCAAGVPTLDVQTLSCVTRISAVEGTTYFGLLLIVTAFVSLVLFRRRDVT